MVVVVVVVVLCIGGREELYFLQAVFTANQT